MEEQEDWTGYTIEVHALKNSSKQIGAIELSEKAADLEKAGNARDIATIHRDTDEMLEKYLSYLPVLEPFCADNEEEEAEKKDISESIRKDCFSKMRAALDNLDMDQMEEVIEEMNQYHYDSWQKDLFVELKEAVEEIDVDRCEAILLNWESKIMNI